MSYYCEAGPFLERPSPRPEPLPLPLPRLLGLAPRDSPEVPRDSPEPRPPLTGREPASLAFPRAPLARGGGATPCATRTTFSPTRMLYKDAKSELPHFTRSKDAHLLRSDHQSANLSILELQDSTRLSLEGDIPWHSERGEGCLQRVLVCRQVKVRDLHEAGVSSRLFRGGRSTLVFSGLTRRSSGPLSGYNSGSRDGRGIVVANAVPTESCRAPFLVGSSEVFRGYLWSLFGFLGHCGFSWNLRRLFLLVLLLLSLFPILRLLFLLLLLNRSYLVRRIRSFYCY